MLELTIILVGFLLVLELAWRFWKFACTGTFYWLQEKQPSRKVEIFKSHPYSLYCKKPNAGGLYPSNRLGYAGVREYDIQRHDNSVRIMVVGGSTVENCAPELGPDSSWPAVLEDILNSQFVDTDIEVVNAGLAGYSSVESMVDFALKGVELQPDILLIYHNINDVLTIQMADGFKPDYSHVREAKSWTLPWGHSIPQLRISFVYEYLRYLVVAAFGWPNTIIDRISSPPWESTEPFDEDRVRVFRRNIANFANLARANGCVPVLLKWECPWETEGVYPWSHLMKGDPDAMGEKYFRYIRGNNSAIKSVADELDFCRYFEVGPFKRSLFMPDNLHFTGEGLRQMAVRVSEGLVPLIKEIIDSGNAAKMKHG